MNKRLFITLLIGLQAPMQANAQGVPIIDGSRLANAISRVQENARNLVQQNAKIAERSNLNDIQQEQIEAYEKFLADTTGHTDVTGFEAGGDFPSAEFAFPSDETGQPGVDRLFGDNQSVESMIIATAKKYQNHPGVSAAGLNPTTWRILFQSLVKQESGFNNAARSPVGAMGFTQLMPATAAELGVNPSDPWQNLDGGARYILQQLNRFGRVDYALAAYNAGAGRVIQYHGVPPFKETQNYVARIQGFYNKYLSEITGIDTLGSMAGVESAYANWGNFADASNAYASYQSEEVNAAMERIAGLLRTANPATAKEAVDINTYMLAERARLMALTLRARAAQAKVEAAGGLKDAAEDLQHEEFWRMDNAN